MTDAVLSWMTLHAAEFFATGRSPQRGTLPLAGGWPYYNVYETRDGKYLSVGALEEKFWVNLCRALEISHYAAQQFSEAKREEIFAALRTAFRTKTQQEWLEILNGNEIPVAPVNNLDETFQNPQIRHRQIEARDDASGARYLRFPVRFSSAERTRTRAAPQLGQDTDKILRSLGYSPDEIALLRTQGVI